MPDSKMVIISTHADEDAERAILPFVMGIGALASDADVLIALQSNAVHLATKGYARHLRHEGFPPFDELLDSFLDMGGRLVACGPCLMSRSIGEDELIEGARVTAAAELAIELLEADAQLTY
jgi:uncharacterized protein involved in oxidation of intracellular sulfur